MAKIERIERQKRIYRKRIPYGMQNFEDVIKDDCYFVDKTPFIENIEESNKYFFFIRPRRFGKSLTLSMLENYYDINKKDQFESLFGKLYIGENPTPERNSYLILHLNFAMISAGLDNYKKGLDAHCNNKFNSFCSRYAHLLPPDIKEEMNQKEDAVTQLGFLCDKCAEAGLKIYLFIDEYDHFTNQILAHKEYEGQHQEQTLGEEHLRHFFNNIKGAAASSIARVFITGVTPVTMYNLANVFNISTNYSLSPEFNEMVGFTEDEVREMLAYYASVLPFRHSVDELIEVMKPWYGNYCFATSECGKTTICNPAMVLDFMNNYIQNNYEIPKKPCEVIPSIDHEIVRQLIRYDKEFARDSCIIKALTVKGFALGNLLDIFPVNHINTPDAILSQLFYFGMVTIDGTYQGNTRFAISNEAARNQMNTLINYGEEIIQGGKELI